MARPVGSGIQAPLWEKDMKLDAQIVGNAGLYYASYRLSLLGWNAMPTSRNARGIDVIAYTGDGTRYIGLQVKTLSKRNSGRRPVECCSG